MGNVILTSIGALDAALRRRGVSGPDRETDDAPADQNVGVRTRILTNIDAVEAARKLRAADASRKDDDTQANST